MKIDPEKDHGSVVWAKLSPKSLFWAGIVIYAKKLNLMYEEKPEKTWIYWLASNTLSNVKNDYIHEFKTDFEKRFNNLTGTREKGVLEAIEILCVQFNINIPTEIPRTKSLIHWAKGNVITKTENIIGKNSRNDVRFIPAKILKEIKKNYCKNIDRANQLDNDLEKPQIQNRKKSYFGKKECLSCLGCRSPIIGKKTEHPLFKGYICEACYIRTKQHIIIISYDSYNKVCCVCCGHRNYNTVLCKSCVRTYCEKCILYFCGSSGFEKIKKVKLWNCYACQDNKVVSSVLKRRTTDEQLQNIFGMFPPVESNLHKVYRISEINVLALRDGQNLVSMVLNTLKHPFKLNVHFENILELGNDEKIKNETDLLIQYSLSCENYDETSNKICREFMEFICLKNKIECSNLNNGRTLFWVYETSAAISYDIRDIICRYTEFEPILTAMCVKDVKKRSRLIWTNIFVCEEDIKKIRCFNIFNHKIEVEKDTSWCYDSIHTLLTCLFRYHIK